MPPARAGRGSKNLGKSCEGLVAENLTALEGDDGLPDDGDLARLDDGLDLIAADPFLF